MLIDIQTASPPYKVLQSKAAEELKSRMAGRPAIARMIDSVASHSSIESRCIIIPDADDSAENKFYSKNGVYLVPDTKTRMNEYEKWSKELTKIAVAKLFEKNNLNPAEINNLITISCTGFFAPGLDYHLINEFKITSAVKRTNIGFMGCAASVVGFNSVLDILNSDVTHKKNILAAKNISIESIKYWALHPGGRAILDSLQTGLSLSDEQLIPSRIILSNFGNMSSASILFVLKEIIDKVIILKGDYCCVVAFGPGLTMEVALLQGQ